MRAVTTGTCRRPGADRRSRPPRATETQEGLKLLAGLVVGTDRLKPFVEGRVAVGEGEQAVACVGVRL